MVMPNASSYKSYCWSLGTTSFRTKNFNKTIEEQLALLDGFWKLPENQNCIWNGNNELQGRYYEYMQTKGFVEGDARNKPKDAREKTSGLADIGLIDDGRHLTEAGLALLNICLSNDFKTDNFFQIPKDSFLYLKQLIKTSYNIDDSDVRPFIVLLYVLSKVDYLTTEEFTYLLPLCTNKEYTDEIINGILSLRDGNKSIDDIITTRLMSMLNYQVALQQLLIADSVDELLICEIGMNRKSRDYDKPYFELYNHLRLAYLGDCDVAFPYVYKAARKINISKYWTKYLFNTVSQTAIQRNPRRCLNKTIFDGIQTERDFRIAFFKTMHLLKAKATLNDYRDLNQRYIKTTDIILFDDGVVRLDIVPKHFFNSVINELYKSAFVKSDLLPVDCELSEIDSCLVIDEQSVIDGVNKEMGADVTTISEAQNILEDNRYQRLHHLIDTKFTDLDLITLLDCFEERNDTQIRSMVTDNADVPTIFEYVLGILWYKVSNRQGKILDYMKLSLDADLLPKTHASGGEADIVYDYTETPSYPKHTLLLEATLAESTNQRRMEMEPVSRHLGQHLINTSNSSSYCVFVTTDLNINVISDFRSRKYTPYYDTQDTTKFVNGMKIIPLQTTELKSIVSKNKKYDELYALFEKAYQSTSAPHEWYSDCILSEIGN